MLLAFASALFALLAYLTVRRTRNVDALTKIDAIQILRSETDNIKSSSDEHSRSLRKEINDTLVNFQESTVTAVGTLSVNINDRLRDFGTRLHDSANQIETRVEGIGIKLNNDLAQQGTEANANRDALRRLVEERLNDATAKQTVAARELREELSGSFHTLGSNVSTTLDQSAQLQKERLAETTKALEALTEKHEKTQDALRQSVETRLDAIRLESATKLDEMRITVDEKLQNTLDTRLGESFNKIVEQLNKVYEQIGEMKTLASSVGNLNNMLSNVKIRGMFGEVQLALLIEEFLTPDQYIKNAQVKDNSSERVEYAIRFRVGVDGEELLLPIDAKFPREDYEHLMEASETGDVLLIAKFRKQLEARIKASAKDIKAKYVSPPRTTEFAILFIPTESLYAELLRQPGLLEHLQRECSVILAGPTTFSAILHAFRMNFHSLALAKQSSEVWKVLSAVKTEFGSYNKVVSTLERQLRSASNSVENLGLRTKLMGKKLRTLEALPDDGSAQKLLGLEAEDLADDDDDEETILDASSEILLPESALTR